MYLCSPGNESLNTDFTSIFIFFWHKTCARSAQPVEQNRPSRGRMADSKSCKELVVVQFEAANGAAGRKNKSCGYGLTRVGQTNSPPFRVGLLDFTDCRLILLLLLLLLLLPPPPPPPLRLLLLPFSPIPDRFSPIVPMVPPVVPYTPLPTIPKIETVSLRIRDRSPSFEAGPGRAGMWFCKASQPCKGGGRGGGC